MAGAVFGRRAGATAAVDIDKRAPSQRVDSYRGGQ
jgi:hypothetical protein